MFFPLETPFPPGILSSQLRGHRPSQPLLGSAGRAGLHPSVPRCLPTHLRRQRPGPWTAWGGCSTESAEGFPGPRVLVGVGSPQPDHSRCPERWTAGLGSLASALVMARVGAALVVLFQWPGRASVCALVLCVGRGQLIGLSPPTRCRPRQPPLWEGLSPPCPPWSGRGGHALASVFRRGPQTPWKEAATSRSPSSRPAQVSSVEGSPPPAS